MPIYVFKCQNCGHRFDRLQKLSAPDPDRCPKCGEAAVRRQVTAPAFRLAGKGWYETDFKGEGEARHNLARGDEPATAKVADKPAANGSGAAPAASPATERAAAPKESTAAAKPDATSPSTD